MTKPAPRDPGGQIQTELSRDLGLVSALAIGVGTMIAAGIFTLSGLAVGYVGSAAIAAFLLAALVASFTALTYCEFSSIYPESGEGVSDPFSSQNNAEKWVSDPAYRPASAFEHANQLVKSKMLVGELRG